MDHSAFKREETPDQINALPWAEVDEQGRLVLPPDLLVRFGIEPGTRLRIEAGDNGIRLHRPVTHLNKVYIEPTNRCNLDCRTCFRNDWDVELGLMSEARFEQVLESLRQLQAPPTVFFGGIGEPLFHHGTIDMVARTKALGCRVELITNGTLLTPKSSRALIQAGLDRLWVSLDGARPESYNDVRLGAELPVVLKNLATFRNARPPAHRPAPEIGIVFVAMRRNIADLPEILAIGRRMRVNQVMVTNLLPPSAAMEQDILYRRSLHDITYLESPWLRKLTLPKMDLDQDTIEPFARALRSNYNVSIAGNNLGGANDVCTFIESGSIAVGWDGSVSPCPPLLHTHTTYLRNYRREVKAHILGNISEHSLLELWNDPQYVSYRERVQRFAFAPCTFCGGCELSRENLSDCFDNPAPACGACLWAQGLVYCP